MSQDIIQHTGTTTVRSEIEMLKIEIDVLNARLFHMEKLSDQHVKVINDMSKAHNAAITTTQKIIKELAQSVSSLLETTKSLATDLYTLQAECEDLRPTPKKK